MLLTEISLTNLAEKNINIPNYRIDNSPNIGIVHIGPGAFFRGHQAWYTDQVMKNFGGNWGISCVSMRSTGVSDALTPQNGLYTLAVLDNEVSYEVLGSIKEVLTVSQQYAQVHQRLINNDTYFVTLTITEKGYCLNNNGELDLFHPDILHDLEGGQPKSTIALLVLALNERRLLGLDPFTVMSCDNVTDNGKKLGKALISYAEIIDLSLAKWLRDNLITPCTMVDSITPATDDLLKKQVKDTLSIDDNWPIKREAFLQWVIEDILPANRPAWDKVGATFTNDVRGFENAKLRLLNCPHSTIAYLGSLLNIETVYDAMQQQEVVNLVNKLITEEVIPSFIPPKELDVVKYSEDILNRFKNPAIRHLLAQIAWDGSQKLPMRILPIIENNLANDISIKSLCVAVASWLLFIRKRFIENEELVDPLSHKLFNIAKECNNNAKHDVGLFLNLESVFGSLANSNVFINSLVEAYELLLPLLQKENTKIEI